MEKESLTVDLFRPEDADGVARLFTEIYGDGYPAKIVYRPQELIKAVEARDQVPVVVRTPENRIVGYSSLFRAAPNQGVYEKGNGAVAVDFRNAGVMGMIFEFVKQTLPRMDEVDMFFGEPVCNFTHIQKAAASVLPLVETAIEVDLMPSDAYEKEKSASGRVSTLLMFMTLTPRPHTVYTPSVYSDQLKFIYDGLDDRRTLVPSEEALPGLPGTRIDSEVSEYAQVARMTVHEAGSDFVDAFLAEEARALGLNAEVFQVWVKLSWPWAGSVVSLLRRRGYFFGGLFPQWFGEDGLLMQKLIPQPNWEGIHLFSERAEKILEFVRKDWVPGA